MLLRIGDSDASDIYKVREIVSSYRPGDTARITVSRRGEELVLDVVFSDMPSGRSR